MNRLLAASFALFLSSSPALAAPKKVALSGKLVGGTDYTVLLLSRDGDVRSAAVAANGKFSFGKLSPSTLKNGTLQLVDANGSYYGPVVLAAKKSKAFQTLTGKTAPLASGINLGTIQVANGYGKAKRAPASPVYNKRAFSAAGTDGAPVGAGKSGFVASQSTSSRPRTLENELGADSDGDGLPNGFDADDDGDLVLDGADPESALSSARNNPFTTLYLGIEQTLNVNAGGVTQAEIDAVIGGENTFVLIFFFDTGPEFTSTTGGHVVCDDALVYCRRAAAGGSTGFFSGVSETSPSVRGQIWSAYDANGSGYPNLEFISTRSAIVAGIQPRTGTANFRAGDVFVVEYTGSAGPFLRKTLSLAPYFVTVPALKSFNGGTGETNIDYSAPAGTSSSPIVVNSSGLLTLTLWRPQRAAIAGAETGDYRDLGGLHYGVVASGSQGEISCEGHYSGLSSTLTEAPPSENPLFPNLWPLNDTSADAAPDAASAISFTVDLKSCLTAGGLSAGTHQISLTAAGEQLAGGANRAAQSFHVTIQ